MGCLLALLALTTGSRLGGPATIGASWCASLCWARGREPDAPLPRRLLHRLLLIGWGWLTVALLLTLLVLHHG